MKCFVANIIVVQKLNRASLNVELNIDLVFELALIRPTIELNDKLAKVIAYLMLESQLHEIHKVVLFSPTILCFVSSSKKLG